MSPPLRLAAAARGSRLAPAAHLPRLTHLAATRAGSLSRRLAASVAVSRAASAAAAASVSSDEGVLQLYNTLTRSKEPFSARPDQGNRVSMYVCGVTVYDYSHVGHARAYVAFDTLFRTLLRRGYDVTYVRNFTDVDDKIIRRAAEASVSCDALTERFISEFRVDVAALRCLPPTAEPRATQHVPDILSLIQRIIEHGHAYALPGGDVYFEVASLPGYGRLSGRAQEDNRAGERVAVDGRKRGAADFALWKSAKPGEPSWPSPWGEGRPGWHIECSAMIQALLGDVVDIHGGGADLMFPHHENEMAQSAAAQGGCGCGEPHSGAHAEAPPPPPPVLPSFARWWVHNGFVTVDSEKMSKSLGNFFTIRQALELYAPTALRLLLLGTHYRAAINYSSRGLDEASERAYYIYQALLNADAALLAAAAETGAPSGPAKDALTAAAALRVAVSAALCDDLNTPEALAALSPPLKAINDLLTTKAGRKAPGRLAMLRELASAVRATLEVLGLGDDSQPERELSALRAAALRRAGLSEEEVAARVAARAEARAAGDFAKSDAVRAELAAKGIALMDGATGGVAWRPTVAVPLEV